MNRSHSKQLLVIGEKINEVFSCNGIRTGIYYSEMSGDIISVFVENDQGSSILFQKFPSESVKKINHLITLLYIFYIANEYSYRCQIFEKEDRVVIEYMDYDETGSDSWRKEFFWNGNEWSEYNPKDKI